MATRRASPARRTTRRRPKLVLPRPRRGRRLPPGMVRLDYPKVQGYIVRIGYIRTKSGWQPRYKAYFSDTRYGSKAKAKAAADAWLKGLIRTGKPPAIKEVPASRAAVNSRRRKARRAA